ncbi:MAG: xanthine dehydrogenase family protein subunit M [Gammaproteobacteria bacterium]|nr:xanthine dehydrogenase family protein subunit M [Gammaproteobacteria bacterium]
MHEFDYVVAENLTEATKLLSDHKGSARILAGGTDLLVIMRNGRRQAKLVIDAKKIPELTDLSLNDEGLSIGAAVTCRQIWENTELAGDYPAIIDSASLIGGIQVQGRATIGGNLCNAAPSADAIPTLIAYGAIAHIQNSDGQRQVPVEEICQAPGQTSLSEDEILVKLTIAKPVAHSGAKFLRFIPRNEMDIAVVNVASMVELDSEGKSFLKARIAMGSVAPTPLFVKAAGDSLAGKEVNDESIKAAALIAREAATPITDMRGTIEHRKQLVEVLTVRTLNAAVARAKGEQS